LKRPAPIGGIPIGGDLRTLAEPFDARCLPPAKPGRRIYFRKIARRDQDSLISVCSIDYCRGQGKVNDPIALSGRIAGFAAVLSKESGSLRRDASAKAPRSIFVDHHGDDMRPNIRAAISNAPPERLLPVEKKLIALSLAIGLALLAVLAAVNHFVPPGF
jgi:hypothetical protein